MTTRLCVSLLPTLLLALAMAVGLVSTTDATAQASGDVWLNTGTGVYHCPGSQYYGNTKRGKHLSESSAIAGGFRAAYGKPCSAQAAKPVERQGLAASPAASARVWVNTNSNVYHCPGTRYYGATKKGRYMSEADAVASGNRAAHGTRCGG